MRKVRIILEVVATFALGITVSDASSIEKGFIKLLPLSNYSQDRFLMEGSSDYLAVSYQFHQCTFPASRLIRRENKTPKRSVL